MLHQKEETEREEKLEEQFTSLDRREKVTNSYKINLIVRHFFPFCLFTSLESLVLSQMLGVPSGRSKS